MIKYSVIVPAYNAKSTIAMCLTALDNQSIPKEDYELIVVDDGSIDGIYGTVRHFSVKYFRQPNQGPSTARNKGAQEAQGEIILFTDADCVPQNDWIENMVKPFNDQKVMAVKGAYKTEQKSLIARFAQIEFEERFDMLKKAESIDMIDTYSAAYRKSIFFSLGGFDPSFPIASNEDTELSYKMSRAGYKMVFNPHAVVFHLNHPDSIKKYARLKFWRGYWRMVVYRRYPDKMLRDSYTPQALKFQILFLFLFLICVPFLWISPHLILFPLIFSIAAFILSTLPFVMRVTKNNLSMIALSPFFLSVRAGSLGLGVLWGVISGRLGREK